MHTRCNCIVFTEFWGLCGFKGGEQFETLNMWSETSSYRNRCRYSGCGVGSPRAQTSEIITFFFNISFLLHKCLLFIQFIMFNGIIFN